MRLHAALEHHALTKPDATALIFGERRLTWHALNAAANRFAHALAALGARRGDRVMMLMANSVQFVEAYYGLAKLGCISAPVVPTLVGSEIAFIANALRARFVIVDAAAADLWRSIAAEVPAVEVVIGVGAGHGLEYDFASFSLGADERNPDVTVDPNDDLTIKFTSGTTGTPKGCVRTHANFTIAALSMLTEIPLREGEIGLIAQPMAAGMAVSFLTLYMFAGVTFVLLPTFEAGLYLDAVERERVSHACAMDWTARRLSAHPTFAERDLSSIRIFHAINQLESLVPFYAQPTFKAGVTAGYASSEAGGLVTYKLPSDFERVRTNPDDLGGRSSGRPGRLYRIEVLGSDMRPLPPGEIGDLAISGPSVFRGYWERPEETAKVLRDGWLITGDLAMKDEGGYIHMRGRSRDVIRSGGMNVYPAEIEPLLLQYPGVAEAAVIGIPDRDWGERVVACLVAGAPHDADAILSYCRSRLAPHKRPKQIAFMERMPLTASGKVIKKDLAAIVTGEKSS